MHIGQEQRGVNLKKENKICKIFARLDVNRVIEGVKEKAKKRWEKLSKGSAEDAEGGLKAKCQMLTSQNEERGGVEL